jgi:hypothetical protein
VKAHLLPAVNPVGETCACETLVLLGREVRHNSSGIGMLSSKTSLKGWDFQRAAAEVLASAPERPFVIKLSLHLEP